MNQAPLNAESTPGVTDPLSGANGETGSIPSPAKPFVVHPRTESGGVEDEEVEASGTSVASPIVVQVPQLGLLNVLSAKHEAVELPHPRKKSRHKNSSSEKGSRPSEQGGTLRIMRALKACVEAISMRVAS
jgi:hypothetical protein